MRNRKCPNHKFCLLYGSCETCDIGKEILKLHRRIKNLRKQNEKYKWISVDERLPEKSGEVLVRRSNYYTAVIPYSHKHKAFNVHDDGFNPEYAIKVTHWMPIPK